MSIQRLLGMLRLRVRVERVDGSKSVEVVGLANSGFISMEPEVLVPASLAEHLELHEVAKPEVHVRITGDGREVGLVRYRNSVKVYLVTEDRVEGPVLSTALVAPGARYVLLNDKLLGRLGVVLIDFADGIWCFKDELGKRERRSV